MAPRLTLLVRCSRDRTGVPLRLTLTLPPWPFWLNPRVRQVVGLRNLGYSGTRHNVGEAFIGHCVKHFAPAHGPLRDNPSASDGGKKSRTFIGPRVTLPCVDIIGPTVPPVSPPRPSRAVSSGAQSKPAATASVPEAVVVPPQATVVFFCPNSLMNVSGPVVKRAMEETGAARVCVVHDGEQRLLRNASVLC